MSLLASPAATVGARTARCFASRISSSVVARTRLVAPSLGSSASAIFPPSVCARRTMMATAAVPSSKPIAPKRIERNEEAVTTLDLALDADGSNGISKDVSSATRLLLTCEHASNYVMAPWSWLQADAHLMNDHWASDPGAEEFTRELHTRLPSLAVLSRFSRLLCDPNRPRESDTMFRAVADGRPIAMNAPERLTDEDRALRLERLYVPYHAALQQAATRCRPKTVLSIHSFTPVYEGQRRTVEVGVLYNADRDRPLAEKFLTAFRAGGMVAELNAPWSAKDGFMYAAEQFSSEETAVIMFEFRNDLATDPKWREKAIGITMQVLKEEGHQ